MSRVGEFAREFGHKHGRAKTEVFFSLTLLATGAAAAAQMTGVAEQLGEARAKDAVSKAAVHVAQMLGIPFEDLEAGLTAIVEHQGKGPYADEVKEILAQLPKEFH